jgi:RNA polymerase sigma-70 factor (ECF subfamily)
MLGHTDDAEDAVQETFLRALRALDRFRGEAALRTWLYRIAVNVCREWARSRPPIDPERPSSAESASLHDTAPSPEEIVVRQMRILEALQTLPPQRRALLLLREVEGWSIGEIAAALSCSKKRVENELYRARCALAAWRRTETGGTR